MRCVITLRDQEKECEVGENSVHSAKVLRGNKACEDANRLNKNRNRSVRDCDAAPESEDGHLAARQNGAAGGAMLQTRLRSRDADELVDNVRGPWARRRSATRGGVISDAIMVSVIMILGSLMLWKERSMDNWPERRTRRTGSRACLEGACPKQHVLHEIACTHDVMATHIGKVSSCLCRG